MKQKLELALITLALITSIHTNVTYHVIHAYIILVLSCFIAFLSNSHISLSTFFVIINVIILILSFHLQDFFIIIIFLSSRSSVLSTAFWYLLCFWRWLQDLLISFIFAFAIQYSFELLTLSLFHQQSVSTDFIITASSLWRIFEISRLLSRLVFMSCRIMRSLSLCHSYEKHTTTLNFQKKRWTESTIVVTLYLLIEFNWTISMPFQQWMMEWWNSDWNSYLSR